MFIDIHAHAIKEPTCPCWDGTQIISTVEEIVARYDAAGIERGVILPVSTIENLWFCQSNEDVLHMAERFPGRIIPFCNLDPRAMYNHWQSPLDYVLKYYRDKGCKGIGEVVANIPMLDPRMQNLFKAAEAAGLPLTFHLAPKEGGFYGIVEDAGLQQLEISCQRFPKLKFFCHSQTFWAEMAANPNFDQRCGYPSGKIEEEGAVPKLMRKYPNLYGDLSAGSGCNALARDEEYAVKFLNEFQDRLFFGTDICRNNTPLPLVDFLTRLRSEKKISETVFQKVARENAIRVLNLENK